MRKLKIIASILAGIACIALAFVYFTTEAGNLPHIIPGFEAGAVKIHFKHGIASLVLGLGLFAYAWFASAPKSADQ